jgi:hypothetical protein
MPKQDFNQSSSSNQARNRANKQHKKDKLKELTATLEVEGDPLLRADTIIEILGVSGMHEGLWYVAKASHSVGKGGYKTTLELKKNATNKPAVANSADLRVVGNGLMNTATEIKKGNVPPTTVTGKQIPQYNRNGKII